MPVKKEAKHLETEAILNTVFTSMESEVPAFFTPKAFKNTMVES
jgi:hypothetical protein